jgi:hypothetical protein
MAYAAWDQGDRNAALGYLRELDGAWPPDHSSTLLLAGVKKAVEGDSAGALALYEDYRKRLLATDLAAKKHNEKRVLSLNLYFMARVAAKLGAAAEGGNLVDLAERLHPGKRRVAQQDPVFR